MRVDPRGLANLVGISGTACGWQADFTDWGWDGRKTARVADHQHDTWEVVVVAGGHGWITCDGLRHHLSRGDAVLVAPGRQHGISLDGRRPLALAWARFRLRPIGTDTLGLADRNASRPFPAPDLQPALALLVAEANASVPASQPALDLFLIRLLRAWAAQPRPADDPARRLEAFIHAHLDGRVSVAHLAQAAGLSSKALARLTRIRWGRSPAQVLMEGRIEAARRNLLDGRTIAETAALCGFPAVRHFSSAFRRSTGCPPGQWLRRAGAITEPDPG